MDTNLETGPDTGSDAGRPEPVAGGSDRVSPVDRAAPVVLALATLASFWWRFTLGRRVSSPFIYHDEGGYAAVARLLVGEGSALYGPSYHPGLGLLLAPAAAVLDPAAFHRSAQVLNALLAAAALPMLYLVARRIVRLERWLAVAVAVVGATTAASILQATMVLPESLFLVATIAAVLAVHAVARHRSLPVAVVAGATLGGTYVVHPRGIVVIAAGAAALAVAWWAGDLDRRIWLAVIGAAAGTVLVGQAILAWSVDRLYPVGTWETLAGSPLESLGEPRGIVVITAGHLWYVLVVTLGAGALGAVVVGGHVWGIRRRVVDPAALFVAFGVLAGLGLAAVASYTVGAGDVGRADQPVYGRYLEQWIPLLLVWAPAITRRTARLAVPLIAATTVVLGWLISAAYPAEVWRLPFAWHNIAGLRPAIDRYGRDYVSETGAVAGVAILVLFAGVALLRRREVWMLPLAAILTLQVVAGTTLVDDWASPSAEAWGNRHRLGPVIERADLGISVGAEVDFEVFYAYNLQFWHPDLDVDITEGPIATTSRLRVAGLGAPPRPGAVLVGTESSGNIGLWALDEGSASRFRAAETAEALDRSEGNP